jgi:hypothetical protein
MSQIHGSTEQKAIPASAAFGQGYFSASKQHNIFHLRLKCYVCSGRLVVEKAFNAASRELMTTQQRKNRFVGFFECDSENWLFN